MRKLQLIGILLALLCASACKKENLDSCLGCSQQVGEPYVKAYYNNSHHTINRQNGQFKSKTIVDSTITYYSFIAFSLTDTFSITAPSTVTNDTTFAITTHTSTNHEYVMFSSNSGSWYLQSGTLNYEPYTKVNWTERRGSFSGTFANVDSPSQTMIIDSGYYLFAPPY